MATRSGDAGRSFRLQPGAGGVTMATIVPFLRNQSAFEPETVHAMSAAFDEVCRALDLNGDFRARETIAVRVIELARRGERDAIRLRDRVLREATGGVEPASEPSSAGAGCARL